jgi:flavin-dependent dehydrogenase
MIERKEYEKKMMAEIEEDERKMITKLRALSLKRKQDGKKMEEKLDDDEFKL